jgi:hypothetical protein
MYKTLDITAPFEDPHAVDEAAPDRHRGVRWYFIMSCNHSPKAVLDFYLALRKRCSGILLPPDINDAPGELLWAWAPKYAGIYEAMGLTTWSWVRCQPKYMTAILRIREQTGVFLPAKFDQSSAEHATYTSIADPRLSDPEWFDFLCGPVTRISLAEPNRNRLFSDPMRYLHHDWQLEKFEEWILNGLDEDVWCAYMGHLYSVKMLHAYGHLYPMPWIYDNPKISWARKYAFLKALWHTDISIAYDAAIFDAIFEHWEGRPTPASWRIVRHTDPTPMMVFGLIIAVGDGYLRVACDTEARVHRFFNIATALPMDLQGVLAQRVLRLRGSIVAWDESVWQGLMLDA